MPEMVLGVGSELVGGTPEQFAELLRREIEKWAKIIKAVGIKAD